MLVFLSVYLSLGNTPSKFLKKLAWVSTFSWLAPGKCLVGCCFSFYVKVPWGSLDPWGWFDSKHELTACDQRQYSREGVVGIGGRGLFHIF
jgi:hypothetical protein